MKLEEALRSLSDKNPVPVCETALACTILAARTAFWQGEEARNLSWFDFLYQQAGYVKKTWWGLQSGLLLLLWLLLRWAESDGYARRCMGLLAPVFIILTLPELWKNDSARALEVEGAALFSLRTIVAARMVLFGMVDLLLLSAFCACCALSLDLPAQDLVADFLLPLLVTCCICLRLLRMGRRAGLVPSLTACLFWLSLWALVVLREDIYTHIAPPVWMGAALLSLLYLLLCALRWWRESERALQYNL